VNRQLAKQPTPSPWTVSIKAVISRFTLIFVPSFEATSAARGIANVERFKKANAKKAESQTTQAGIAPAISPVRQRLLGTPRS
jgi:hypothetical protein